MISSTSLKSPRNIGFAILILLLAGWFYVKMQRFDALAYTSDLFSHLQISNSWLKGKPLLYENCYGDHAKIHNYYFTPLFGFFTIWAGAYGLFIAHVIILAVVCLLLWNRAGKEFPGRFHQWHWLALIILLLFGPLSFYIWDDPAYGWHSEMLFVPVSALFIYALYISKKWLIALSALLLILVKEDGAVIGACLHIAFLLTTFKYYPERYTAAQKAKKILLSGSIWVIVFAAGLLILYAQNNFGWSRTEMALQGFGSLSLQEKLAYFLPVLKVLGLLLAPVFIYVIVMFGWRSFIVLFFLLLPMLIVQSVSSMIYFGDYFHSLVWVPRMSQFWGFTLSFILIHSLLSNSRLPDTNKRLLVSFGLIVLTWVAQDVILFRMRDLNRHLISFNAAKIIGNALHGQDPFKKDTAVSEIRKLAKVLPRDWEVAPPGYLFGAFPHHTISWQEHLNVDPHWHYPEVMLTDWKNDNPALTEPVFMTYKKYEMGRFEIRIKPEVVSEWENIRQRAKLPIRQQPGIDR